MGAVIAAIAFEVVLHAANLKVVNQNPGSNITPFNLVSNPSGDSGTSGWGSGNSSLKTVPSSKPGVVGADVFRLTAHSPTETASAYAPNVDVTPGENLTASAYIVSLPSPGTASVSVDWKTNFGVYLSSTSPGATVTNPGSRASLSATAPKRARNATIIVNLLGAKPGTSMDFDALVAEKAASG